jgi:hypothetical protein
MAVAAFKLYLFHMLFVVEFNGLFNSCDYINHEACHHETD